MDYLFIYFWRGFEAGGGGGGREVVADGAAFLFVRPWSCDHGADVSRRVASSQWGPVVGTSGFW